jgi:hypothetical protein
MQPLTHQVWEKHFTELRPHILREWPQVDRQRLYSVGNDWDGLVELLQDETRLSADLVIQRLRKLEVEELGLGTGESPGGDESRASLDQLRLGAGFSEADRSRVVARLEKLNRRLKRFPADGTELEIMVKDRDGQQQSVTLECMVPKFHRFVATSTNPDLMACLADVRDDLWRQIDNAVGKRKTGVS